MIETDLDWMNKYRQGSNYIPGQQEIKYFWPLTEQIPLALDYTDCAKKSELTLTSVPTGGNCVMMHSGTGASWTASQLIVTQDGIETPEITFTLNRKPFIIKRLAYKFLGIKWKIK